MLKKMGSRYSRIDGSINVDNRQITTKAFNKDQGSFKSQGKYEAAEEVPRQILELRKRVRSMSFYFARWLSLRLRS